MTLTVNGVDLTPYVAFGGIKWARNEIDAPDSGRTMDGVMHRGRVTTKIRLDITCRPLEKSELGIVLNAIQPEYVSVTYDDPLFGDGRTVTMYSNNNSVQFAIIQRNGQEWWQGSSFPLIEQ